MVSDDPVDVPLDQRDPESLTRSERAARARIAEKAISREAEAKIRLDRAVGGVGGEPSFGPAPPCPDPFAPESAKMLYAAWFRRMWSAAHGPLTLMDTTNGFGAVRLAAGIGKTPEPPEEYRLDMGSLLGKPASKAKGEEPKA